MKSLSEEFKRRGQNIESALPPDMLTSKITLAMAVSAYPFSSEAALAIAASPTIVQGFAGTIQSIGSWLERPNP